MDSSKRRYLPYWRKTPAGIEQIVVVATYKERQFRIVLPVDANGDPGETVYEETDVNEARRWLFATMGRLGFQNGRPSALEQIGNVLNE